MYILQAVVEEAAAAAAAVAVVVDRSLAAVVVLALMPRSACVRRKTTKSHTNVGPLKRTKNTQSCILYK